MSRLIFLLTAIVMFSVQRAESCTSAIVSGKLTRDGRPLLWKHRDTGTLDNFVQKVEPTDSTYGYVALFNKGDSDLREAWIGMNDKGFAIMNTASYNLAPDTARFKDQEGIIMTAALKRCARLEDFADLLKSRPRPMGVQANFGVIDAYGNGGYFETDDYDYTLYPLDDDNPIILRTNFSVSGGEGGLGIARYENACDLLEPHILSRDISPEVLTEELSRSFYRSSDGTDLSKTGENIIGDKDFIPRHSTSASVVIEGVDKPAEVSECIMWTVLGYPPCSYVEAVTIDHIPDDLLPAPDGRALRCDKATELKRQVFVTVKGKKGYFINVDRLNEISSRMRVKSLDNYSNHRNKKLHHRNKKHQ